MSVNVYFRENVTLALNVSLIFTQHFEPYNRVENNAYNRTSLIIVCYSHYLYKFALTFSFFLFILLFFFIPSFTLIA